MGWYTASAVMLFVYEDGIQSDFPVWENLILVEAESDSEALSKATKFAKEEEGDDSGSLTVNGRKARRVFKGIRKLLTVVNLNADEDVPTNGAEVSFSDLSFSSESDLDSYINGEPITLICNN